MKKTLTLLVVTVFLFTTASCYTPQTRQERMATGGAGLGALGGAIAGALIGDFKGALWGAAIGGLVGGIAGYQVGAYMDEQERQFEQALAYERDASIRREGDVLIATYSGDLLFDFDSSVIKPGAYDELDKTAQILRDYPETRISIEGHTDATGPEIYNQRLSVRRADAVASYLVSRGVDSARIRTLGFGESQPVATNQTPAGRQQNRRVELKLMPIVQS